MRLAEVVSVSRAVAETSGRLEKISHLADLLKRVPADEIASLTTETRRNGESRRRLPPTTIVFQPA